jgi:2OG-Fe(II) oxygenase superfamily
MMSLHTPSPEVVLGEGRGGGGRNRWRGARERDRLHARFQIQERMRAASNDSCTTTAPAHRHHDDPMMIAVVVTTSNNNNVTTTSRPPPQDPTFAPPSPSVDTRMTTTATATATTDITNDDDSLLSFLHDESSIALLQEALQRIGKNNVSFFSLSCLNQHRHLFNRPFPAQDVLWWWTPAGEDDVGSNGTDTPPPRRRLVSEPQLLSRWGAERLKTFKDDFIPTLSTCTLLEWIVWTERDSILPAVLLGGMDVTQHGQTTKSTIMSGTSMKRRQLDIGKRFFQLQAPYSLKAYLVQRVHALRMNTLIHRREDGEETVCPACQEKTPVDGALQFETCGHVLCTDCVWIDIVDHCVSRLDRHDIFVCPLCDDQDRTTTVLAPPPPNETPLGNQAAAQMRRVETMAKFNALPAAVDQSGRKKVKTKKSRPLCSNWACAINAGSTQPIRMEKFFKALDTIQSAASYNFVYQYLQVGVDVDARDGEYGATGLWMAVWKNNVRLVGLLLDYGSDPNATAHGDLSCVRLARTLGHVDILDMLLQMGGHDEDDDDYVTASVADFNSSVLPNFYHDTLIDVRTDHAGAGSYIFDDFLRHATIDALTRLRERIPIAPSIKTAEKMCSIRSYFCDALGFVVNPLSNLLVQAFGTTNVKVFPYMRFLYYKDAGAELAPHVDLSRADSDTGLRSTHSFLLYLTTCDAGGETALLQGLPLGERNIILAKVQPVRGRLLIFPHQCPHEGFAVIDVPKLLIRGEVYIPEGCEPTRRNR